MHRSNASSTLKKRESYGLEMDRSFELSSTNKKRPADFLQEKTNMDCSNSLNQAVVYYPREGLRIISSLFSGHTIILRGLSHFLKNVQGKSFCKKAWQ